MNDATAERWLPVPGYEGLYLVSDWGRVRSLPRATTSGRILKLQPANKLGHLSVALSRQGVVRRHLVHRLVMEAFVGPCPEGQQVRHWDGNPANNKLSNLLYGTPSEDGYDRVRHGTHPNAAKTHCKYGHKFTPENTVIGSHGDRNCLTCKRKSARATQKRRQARMLSDPEYGAQERAKTTERARRRRAANDLS